MESRSILPTAPVFDHPDTIEIAGHSAMDQFEENQIRKDRIWSIHNHYFLVYGPVPHDARNGNLVHLSDGHGKYLKCQAEKVKDLNFQPTYSQAICNQSYCSRAPSYQTPCYHASCYQPSSYQPSSYQPSSYQPSSYQPSSYQPSYGQPLNTDASRMETHSQVSNPQHPILSTPNFYHFGTNTNNFPPTTNVYAAYDSQYGQPLTTCSRTFDAYNRPLPLSYTLQPNTLQGFGQVENRETGQPSVGNKVGVPSQYGTNQPIQNQSNMHCDTTRNCSFCQPALSSNNNSI